MDVDQRVLVGVADQQDRFGDVTNLINRKTGLIGIDQRDVVRSGNVAVIGDDEAVRQLTCWRAAMVPRGMVERIVAP